MQGITGKLSGKMGAAVFRVREGQQIVTQYNPIVKNPNTEGQQAQRAKFKLMSQLAAIMSSGFGTMAVTKRKSAGQPSPRNAFTSLNFPLVDVDIAGDTVTAKIPMEQLQLTSSFRYLPELVLSKSSEVEINVKIDDVPVDVSTVRVIVVSYPVTGDASQANIKHIIDVPVALNAVNYDVEVDGAGDYTVLAYGLIPSESAKASVSLDNIHTPADEDFISAVKLNAMVADGLIAETKTVGANFTLTA